jgi:hypothetical protein
MSAFGLHTPRDSAAGGVAPCMKSHIQKQKITKISFLCPFMAKNKRHLPTLGIA